MKIINYTKSFFQKKENVIFLGLFSLGIIAPLRSVVFGGIPFWFDPARDLILAQSNLSKFSLIGVPTGIPGLNYGPYWIWLLSCAMAISQDPRFISFFVLAVPYLLILPILLLHMKKVLLPMVGIGIWLILMVNYEPYATFIWNPSPAPFLFVAAFFVFVILLGCLKDVLQIKSLAVFLTFGFLSGLIFNFHFAFGVATMISSLLSTLIIIGSHLRAKSISLKDFFFALVCVGIGITISFLPTLIFESRHGFNQIRTLYLVVVNSFLYATPAVGLKGLSQQEIFSGLLQMLQGTFSLPWLIVLILLSLLTAWTIFSVIRQKELQKQFEVILFPLLVLFFVLYLLFSSKNPVWGYHLIGLEIVILILFGIFVSRTKFLSYVFLAFSVFLLITQKLIPIINEPLPDFSKISSLSTKEQIVDRIVADAKTNTYSFASYDQAIYTYDYDYLFSWRSQKTNPAKKDLTNAKIIYLIIPQTTIAVEQDFISYKTPEKKYATLWTQIYPDKTRLYKRILK